MDLGLSISRKKLSVLSMIIRGSANNTNYTYKFFKSAHLIEQARIAYFMTAIPKRLQGKNIGLGVAYHTVIAAFSTEILLLGQL